MSGVCAFTSVCEEDSGWLGQYLAEAERLSLPFAMHFDRCSDATRSRVIESPLCVGVTAQQDPRHEFRETDKQAVLDLVAGLSFSWALAWDVDEIWEHDAAAKIEAATRTDADYLTAQWVNLWGDERHVRRDGPFASSWRVKFYRLSPWTRWHFYHPVVNGPRCTKIGRTPGWWKKPRPVITERSEVVCLHAGLMTRELRQLHKARWDRIYGAAVGANPYQFWNYALDEERFPASVAEHDYFGGAH